MDGMANDFGTQPFTAIIGDKLQLYRVAKRDLEFGFFIHSVITAPCDSAGQLALLRENQHFVIRMLQGNRVFGFESEILKYYTMPYPHLHLSHPQDIESIVVRGARRINTANRVVSVQSDTLPSAVSATLLNISMSGALLQCKQALGQLDDKISFSIEPDISGMQKYLRIHAVIRNLSTPQDRDETGDDHYRHGLQFLSPA